MPPKRARGSPSKTRARKPQVNKVLPAPLLSSRSSSQSSTPRSPATLSATRAPSSSPLPPPPPVSSRATATSPTSRASSPWAVSVIALLVVLVAAVTLVLIGRAEGEGSRQRHPCACATSAAASNPLAKALLSRRSGVSGVHWRQKAGDADRLDFAARCGDVHAVPLHGPFTSVEQLREAMQKAFDGRKGQCVIWITSPEAIQKVANALKELLENNALGGTPVVPPHGRGTLVMKSPLSREELKHTLPHRVVHMLTSID